MKKDILATIGFGVASIVSAIGLSKRLQEAKKKRAEEIKKEETESE